MLLSVVLWIIGLYIIAAVGERFTAYYLRNVLLPHTPTPAPVTPPPPSTPPFVTPCQSSSELKRYVNPSVLQASVPSCGVFKQEQSDLWRQLDTLQKNKLWHQLILKLLDTTKSSQFEGQENVFRLYNSYIKSSQDKMNPILVAEVMAHLVEKLAYPTQAVQLLEEAESCVENSDGALALYKTLRAEYLFTHMGDVKESKRVLDQAKKLLRGIPVTAIVHGRFYSLSSRWHESQGHYEKVYRKILRYLDCVHVENIPKDESLRLSKALVTAALVGKKLFDLGEVVCHPVMTALSPEDKWLLQLLHHMNEGRLDAVLDMEETCTTHPLLRLHWDNILDKAQLLCLMQMFFTRHPQQRVLPLSDVAGQMRMPESDVELLLIRAMAQGLIRGSIDQVESIVRVIWVRPRMLHREQLIPFLNRLDDWCSEIKSLESWAVEKIEQLEALS